MGKKRMRTANWGVVAFACLSAALLPSSASAQSTISGVVRDASGAVVANATVEAASDVLIERTRTIATNGEGRYALVDLRPGRYVVTASAAGFETVKQTVEVPANVTVPVDATLKVGSSAETISVEARVATVDVENVAHPQTLSRSEMDTLPTGRYMQSIGSYVSGAHLNLPDIGGSQQIEQNYISVHGSGSVHDTYMLDGMLVNTTYNDGQIQQYIDNAAIQETTYQTSSVTAEASGGGLFTNLVPKDGGNQFHADLFFGGSGGGGWWQGNNLDAKTNARGLTAQDKTVKIEDYDGSFGGPIKRDKLWFAMTGRRQVTFTQAGASTYPDGKPGIQDGYLYNGTFRLTWQMNQKNKFSAFWLRNWKNKDHEIVDGGQATLGTNYIPADPSVSATQRNRWPMYYILQTRWTGTPTPKLIIQAGMSISHLDYNDLYQPGIEKTPFTDAWYAATTAVDQGTLRRYFSGRSNQYFQTTRNVFTATAIYVNGSHQTRFGFQYSFGPNYFSTTMNGDGAAIFNNGLPIAFYAYNTPYYQRPYLDGDAGIFGMDTWHIKRVSITAGLRWEYLAGEITEENAPAGRFAPARRVPDTTCETIKGMGCWKNWTPRLGIVYDVFGSHKTAIKAGFGKYNSQYSTGFTSNFNPMNAQTQSVFWNTAGLTTAGGPCAPVQFNGVAAPNPNCFASGGFAPQGTANSAVAALGLGVSTNPNFGALAAVPTLDSNWHREYNYQYTAGVQQELYKGVTLNANWYRRSNYQSTLLLNNATNPSSWTPLNITNPLDGSPLTVFNLSTPAGASRYFQTNGPQSLVRNVYTGYEASVVARMPHGIFGVFGWTIDRQLDRACAENATLGGLSNPNSMRYCDMFGSSGLTSNGIDIASLGKVPSPPWQNEFKAQGSVPVRWGIVGAVSLYSNRYQGNFAGVTGSGSVNNGYLARTWTINANTLYPAGCIGCTPGQRVFPTGFALGQASETIQLVAPGQVLTPRLNQVDISVKKTFKFREKYVLEPEAQLFNVFNSNAAVTQSVAVGSTIAPFATASQCRADATIGSAANCGLGGTVTTITNPRLLRVALLIRF
jgi:hypothetical protein